MDPAENGEENKGGEVEKNTALLVLTNLIQYKSNYIVISL